MMAYIDDMPTVIKASDIVITRCGAMTLAEISASAVAAILIPSPNVTGDHQYKNANLIYKLGAGMLLEEKNLCEESLISVLEQLENDLHLRKSIAQKINGLYVHNSNKIIAEEIIRLTK